MSNKDFSTIMSELSKPFPVDAITWKPQVLSKDHSRGMAVAYADLRAYEDRLNEVCPEDWSTSLQFVVAEGKVGAIVHLTVAGITRAGDGESPITDDNAFTGAYAQAFKRAASRFGLGRHLYDLPKLWVEYDDDHKRFPEHIVDYLNRRYDAIVFGKEEPEQPKRPAPQPSHSGNGNGGNGRSGGSGNEKPDPGTVKLKFGKYKGMTLSQVAEKDRGYLEWLAEKGRNEWIAERARAVLAQGNGNGHKPEETPQAEVPKTEAAEEPQEPHPEPVPQEVPEEIPDYGDDLW